MKTIYDLDYWVQYNVNKGVTPIKPAASLIVRYFFDIMIIISL